MNDDQESGKETRSTAAFAIFAVLHLFCCGIPLLLLTGVSFNFVWPTWPVIGAVLMVLGVVGFVWYIKRGCVTLPSQRRARLQIEQNVRTCGTSFFVSPGIRPTRMV